MTRWEIARGAEPPKGPSISEPPEKLFEFRNRESVPLQGHKLLVYGNTASGKTEYLIRYALLKGLEGMRCYFVSSDRLETRFRDIYRNSTYCNPNLFLFNYQQLADDTLSRLEQHKDALLVFDDLEFVNIHNHCIFNEIMRVISSSYFVAVSISSRYPLSGRDLGDFRDFKIVQLPPRRDSTVMRRRNTP